MQRKNNFGNQRIHRIFINALGGQQALLFSDDVSLLNKAQFFVSVPATTGEHFYWVDFHHGCSNSFYFRM